MKGGGGVRHSGVTQNHHTQLREGSTSQYFSKDSFTHGKLESYNPCSAMACPYSQQFDMTHKRVQKTMFRVAIVAVPDPNPGWGNRLHSTAHGSRLT